MGKIIVIDGLDGCGKATQSGLLEKRLSSMGLNVHRVSFPDYEDISSFAVKEYLSGNLGVDAEKINPYMCSLFYAVDRGIQFSKELFKLYEEPESILICDRYLSANIIHQGSKLSGIEKKKAFSEWVYDLEVNKMGLPMDNITIVLTMPIEVSQKLMMNRYTGDRSKMDIHELNIPYLSKCYEMVDIATEHLNSKGYNWKKIECANELGVRSIEGIENEIWMQIKEIL